jgi:hypothetical protein
MKSDKQIFSRIEKELPVRDHEQVFRDWSRYVSDPNALRTALRSNTGLFEYNFWLTMNNESWFMDGLEQLLDLFHQAKTQNENECLQALVELDPQINSGLKNMQRVFHLEADKSVTRLDLLGKVCFREIGDIIEGTLRPFMQLMVVMAQIATSSTKAVGGGNEITLGDLVKELLSISTLAELYQPGPWNVSMNQWRNIAQHYSFKIDSSHAALECEYGTKTKKIVFVDRDSLIALLKRIHAIAYVHKTAHLLFFINNAEELASRITVTPEPSEDTIKSHVMTTVVSNEFKLISLKSKRDWRITLRDQVLRSRPDRHAALNNIAAAFKFVVRDRALKMTVYYQDEKGEQTLKAIVK